MSKTYSFHVLIGLQQLQFSEGPSNGGYDRPILELPFPDKLFCFEMSTLRRGESSATALFTSHPFQTSFWPTSDHGWRGTESASWSSCIDVDPKRIKSNLNSLSYYLSIGSLNQDMSEPAYIASCVQWSPPEITKSKKLCEDSAWCVVAPSDRMNDEVQLRSASYCIQTPLTHHFFPVQDAYSMMCVTSHWLKCLHTHVIHDERYNVFSSFLCSSLCLFPCLSPSSYSSLFTSIFTLSWISFFMWTISRQIFPVPPSIESLTVWQTSLLSQVMSPSSFTSSTIRRLSNSSSRW